MGIRIFRGVGINSNRNTPCVGGVFNVRVLVLGATGKTAGTYDVFIYDDDFGFDTLLAQLNGVRVPGGGNFRRRHRFNLNCDAVCNVQGPLGNSNENPANIYAYVEENAIVFAASAQSRRINLTCRVDDDDEKVLISPDGGQVASPRNVLLEVPGGAVAEDVRVRISRRPEELDEEYFRGNVGTDVAMLRVGTDDIAFARDVKVRWTLTGGERARLQELDGCVVGYDTIAKEWNPLSDVEIFDDYVSFTIKSGGLFGIAPHTRYDGGDVTFRALKNGKSKSK